MPPEVSTLNWTLPIRAQLRDMAQSAAESHADWQRRWFISLAVANGAGLGAVASAIAGSAMQQSEPGSLIFRWALLPAAWVFAVGLLTGGALPYCWTKKVEHIEDWTWVREAELDAGGVTQIPLEETQTEASDTLSDRYDAHFRRWSLIFNCCQTASAYGFLVGLVWLLACFTKWALVS